MNEQDPPKYDPYEPTATGMMKLAQDKEDSNSFLAWVFMGIAIPMVFVIFGMADSPVDYYPVKVVPVASATQTPSRLNPVPAKAMNTNAPPTQPKMPPVPPVVKTGNVNAPPTSQQP